jgi:hypothetical protein
MAQRICRKRQMERKDAPSEIVAIARKQQKELFISEVHRQ